MSRLNFRDTESISHRPSLTSRCRRHTQDKVPFAFYLPPVPLGLATLGAQSVAGGGAGTTLHVGHYHLVLLKLRDPDRQITALPAYGPVLIRHRTAALLLCTMTAALLLCTRRRTSIIVRSSSGCCLCSFVYGLRTQSG